LRDGGTIECTYRAHGVPDVLTNPGSNQCADVAAIRLPEYFADSVAQSVTHCGANDFAVGHPDKLAVDIAIDDSLGVASVHVSVHVTKRVANVVAIFIGTDG